MERFNAGENEIIKKESQLMHHEKSPEGRRENQIPLAYDLYIKLHPEEKINENSRDFRNKLMIFWSDEGYSEAYRNLENDERLNNHPRLRGNIHNITVDDVIEYRDSGNIKD